MGGWFAFVPFAVVGSVLVVVVEVRVEVFAESGDGGFVVGDEGRFPAFLAGWWIWTCSTLPLDWGRPGAMKRCSHTEAGQGVTETVIDELVAPVGGGALPVPVPAGEVFGDPVGEGGGVESLRGSGRWCVARPR